MNFTVGLIICENGDASAWGVSSDGSLEQLSQDRRSLVENVPLSDLRKLPVVVGLDPSCMLWRKCSAKGPLSAFDLESDCPIDAENMAVRRACHSPELALIAIRDRIRPVVNELVAAGVDVAAIVPFDLCVARKLRAGIKEMGPVSLIIPSLSDQSGDKRKSQVKLDVGGRVSSWTTFYGDRPPIGVEAPPDAAQSNADTQGEDRRFSFSKKELDHAVAGFVLDLRRKSFDVYENFVGDFCTPTRMNPLQRASRFLMACVLVLLLVSGAAQLLVAQRLANAASICDAHSAAIFNAAVPHAGPTRMYARTIGAEIDRQKELLKAIQTYARTDRVFSDLDDLLKNFPSGIRFEVESITLDQEQVMIVGEVNRLEDLDRIKASLAGCRLWKVTNQGDVYSSRFTIRLVRPDLNESR